MVELLNNNEGVISAVLTLLSIGISVLAIIISIKSINNQQKMNLFNERYKVYSIFAQLFESSSVLASQKASTTFKVLAWDVTAFFFNQQSQKLGEMILDKQRLLSENKELDAASKEKIEAEIKEHKKEKSEIDYRTVREFQLEIEKGKLLFDEDIGIETSKYVKLCLEAADIINNAPENVLSDLFDRIEQQRIVIEGKKIMERMRDKIDFRK